MMIEVRRAIQSDRLVVQHLLELYFHDLSEFWDYDVDEHGLYGYNLDDYWRKPSHIPFVFLVQGRYAGFALVNDDVCLPQNEHWMAQFFVLRKYRRQGVASAAATSIFESLPGRWEVGQIPANLAAQAFWRTHIAAYTKGAFSEAVMQEEAWQGALQWFDNQQVAERGVQYNATASRSDPVIAFPKG